MPDFLFLSSSSSLFLESCFYLIYGAYDDGSTEPERID